MILVIQVGRNVNKSTIKRLHDIGYRITRSDTSGLEMRKRI